MKNIDLGEIKRYLKYDSETLDKVTEKNIKRALEIVAKMADFKYLYRKYSIVVTDKQVDIKDANLIFESISLANHLKKCDEAVLFIATLGLTLDKEIERLEVIDLALAYAVNAVAVAYLEEAIDETLVDIDTSKNQTSRYSIGYGDLELKYQNDLINILDASKQIGVYALETHLMVPAKTVSAIVGLSFEMVNSDLKKCDNCLTNGKCSGRCLEELEYGYK